MKNTNEILNLSKEEKHHLKRAVIKSLRPLKYMNKAEFPKDEAELYSAYRYTLKKYGFEDTFDSELLSPFYKLAQYDKVNQHKDDYYLVKLDQLLMYLRKHIDIINNINSLPKNATPHTSYSNHKKYIEKEINHLIIALTMFEEMHQKKNLLYDEPYNKDYKSLHITLTLLELYINEPFVFSAVIKNLYNPDFKSLNEDLAYYIKDYSNQIFSYKLKLNSIHITKSFNLNVIEIYKNFSIHNQLLNIEKQIDDKFLIEQLEKITEKFLDKKAKPNVKNINAQFKQIDLIDDILILQPINKKPITPFKINNYDELISLFK